MRSATKMLIAFVVLALPAQAQLPDSPTGRGGNTLIQMFGTGPDTVTIDFLQTTFSREFLAAKPLEETLQWLKDEVKGIGPLELRGVEKTGMFSATIIGRSSVSDEKIKIDYQVADTAPHSIEKLTIERDSATPRRQLSLSEMVIEAESYLDSLSEDQFSGAVLVAKGDEVILERAQGLASRRYAVPIEMETLFNLGSINKIFTKIAIAQLAAGGQLSFSDTMARYLPDYPDREVAEKITIQQLVTHSAGLGDIFTDAFAKTSKERFQTPRDYFELFAHRPLLFEPGTSQRYSNGGYMVLGAIIEAVSGQTYDEYVQQNIFDPAGMSATGSYAMNDPVPNLAHGHTRHSPNDHDGREPGHGPDPTAPWRENSFMIPFTGTPAGGGYSNAADLLRFRQALVGHKLVDARYTAWVVTDRLPEKAPPDSGFGIGVAGGAPGVNAELEISDEFTIIVLTNLDPPSASIVARTLRELVESIVD